MSKLLISLKRDWVKLYFILSLASAAFAYGFTVAVYKFSPYDFLKSGLDAAEEWMVDDNFKHYLGIRPGKFILPARYPGSGVTLHQPGKPQKGLTLIMSMWENTNGMDLINLNGELVHQWRVSFTDIWPKADHLLIPLTDWDTIIHGVQPYPNGDMVIILDGAGLLKIDKCSNVLWKIPHPAHHSIHKDKEGNLWIPGNKIRHQGIPNFPFLKPPIEDELLLKVSPDGKILREISILDVILKSRLETLFFVNTGGPLTRTANDITHINDIEILNETMAPQFPMFNEGDIMVSMRTLNLIVIIDPVTETIKWWMIGPFYRQHDPDFLPNGRIAVFDNQTDGAEGTKLGGSRILSIDPVSRRTDIIYQSSPKNFFYTAKMGKHQFLPNGNILITESLAGRIFEINPQGEVVWSYINRYDEDEVYRITEGIRLNEKFGNFAQGEMKCP